MRILRVVSGMIFGSLFLLSGSVVAMEVTGSPRVVDGDTIAIGSQVIRLHGIDAPENGQDCNRANGKKYNCGGAAEKALKNLVAGGVRCSGESLDNYNRLIAVCFNDERDINSAMVLAGWALAFRKFSTDYVDAEDQARNAERGLWAGKFQPPWEVRSDKWASAVQSVPDSECPIKGNINSKGVRIYHAPWSRSYKRTKINPGKGERWFCTEGEALAAGWRAPYR